MRNRNHRTLLTMTFVFGAFVIGISLLVVFAPGLTQVKALHELQPVPGATTHRFLPAIGNNKLPTPMAIAAGSLHTCALMSSGGVKCWGQNEFGQVGDESKTNQFTPAEVSWH